MDKPPKNPFDYIQLCVRVLKISIIVLVPYWSFGFEGGVIVGIILACLFLSKTSLTVLEINEYLHRKGEGKPTKKPASKFAHKPDADRSSS